MNERDEFDRMIEQEQAERVKLGLDAPTEIEGVILNDSEGSLGLNGTSAEEESNQENLCHPERSRGTKR